MCSGLPSLNSGTFGRGSPVINAISAVLRVVLVASLLIGGCDQKPVPEKAPTVPLVASTPAVPPVARGAAARLDAKPAPLSAVALLGKQMFYDATLSGSGKLSCSSCHDPDHAYAPGNGLAVQRGGHTTRLQGLRSVPSLTYRERTPVFSVGPDTKPDADDHSPATVGIPASPTNAKPPSVAKIAATREVDRSPNSSSAAAPEMVPQGGMDWDGRASMLSEQAGGPLLDPNEMANDSGKELLAKLKRAPYAPQMVQLFGPGVFSSPNLALGEAYFALARYQIEERSFHPYDSKFDHYLAARAPLNAQELRGMQLFDDPKKGNCAACHPDKPSKDGRLAPLFTDFQFEALSAPRNPQINANRDPSFFDQGLCGPIRKDTIGQAQYCGLFKTPSLRNAATRRVFFHNGVFRSLQDVVRFYVERETRPEKWYPRMAGGSIDMYDDIPPENRVNVDLLDAPFDRKRGQEPALTETEIEDVVAFLQTLTDGYQAASGMQP
jgi:cytochrome c peroxidase